MSSPLSIRRWIHKRPNLFFWSAFVLLNVLLFLPMALLDPQSSKLLPSSTFQGGWWAVFNQLFIWRDNLDPWRLSTDLAVLIALWVWVPPLRRRWIGGLFGMLYLLNLVYALYEAIVSSIYLLEPSFYSQFFLAVDGLPFLFEHLHTGWWVYVGALVSLLASLAAVVWLTTILLRSGAAPGLLRVSRVAIALLAAVSLAVTAAYQTYTARPEMVFSSFGYKLHKNLAVSAQIQEDVQRFDGGSVQEIYNYSGSLLAEKPDIYLIFVESYGSVLYKRDHFRAPYVSLLETLEITLADAGWRTATALSESPTWGGGSWLAYTSTLFGMRIDNHPQYLDLRNKYQVERYPSLGATLDDQGYHYVWLSALAENISEVGWAKYTRMMAVDELIRNREMDYVGPRYGWGPAPPDQWVLHWAHSTLKAKNDQPLLLFTITQNSHYPWTPHPSLVEDWRTLNQPGQEEAMVDPDTIDLETRRSNYWNAIEYQMRMLTQWILDVGDENSLFVLVGDHQPPAVSRRSDGWSTPVHVISKNQAFVDSLGEYGFVPTLTVSSLEPTLRHEGLYSLLMQALVREYGAADTALPAYLPDGIVPKETAATH